MLKKFFRDQSGATAIEYGLIIALVFLGISTALFTYGEHVQGMYTYLSNSVAAASK
ncbi:Flp family type IVb pilin [Asticcacaulis sp. BYS171W]|uniref:Flp family type IVb pilin n=1 Tax=Asticcacaulis aquaticus TaxID=2984212 RepID=A0ABT5HYQ2_9CAUL|nr:Flp family type IVb pilin [Asticcacaulis aquaticus]MDC7685158.1 Flp family type IVb pilin [Asticcacaulis aquaticus]